jgi:hypothetical protein
MKHNFEMQLTKFKKYFNLKDEKNEKYFTIEQVFCEKIERLSLLLKLQNNRNLDPKHRDCKLKNCKDRL